MRRGHGPTEWCLLWARALPRCSYAVLIAGAVAVALSAPASAQTPRVRLAAPVEPGLMLDVAVAGHDGRQLLAA